MQRAIQTSGSAKIAGLDSEFFGTDTSNLVPRVQGKAAAVSGQTNRVQLYSPLHGRVNDQGQVISDGCGVNAAIAAAQTQAGNSGKKHKKGKKNRKARSGEGLI